MSMSVIEPRELQYRFPAVLLADAEVEYGCLGSRIEFQRAVGRQSDLVQVLEEMDVSPDGIVLKVAKAGPERRDPKESARLVLPGDELLETFSHRERDPCCQAFLGQAADAAGLL
jgi:hypothetical protein